jgi:hypothetical protein
MATCTPPEEPDCDVWSCEDVIANAECIFAELNWVDAAGKPAAVNGHDDLHEDTYVHWRDLCDLDFDGNISYCEMVTCI